MYFGIISDTQCLSTGSFIKLEKS